jgi:Trypsin-co-occurring domain 2
VIRYPAMGFLGLGKKKVNQPDSPSPPNSPISLGLDNVIAAVASDLVKARNRTAEEDPNDQFGLYLDSAELELQFTVSQDEEKKDGGGVTFTVIGIGGGIDHHVARGISQERVHRIKLNLSTPVVIPEGDSLTRIGQPGALGLEAIEPPDGQVDRAKVIADYVNSHVKAASEDADADTTQ